MRTRCSLFAICLSAVLVSNDAQASRQWREIQGRTVRGTFQQLQAGQALIQTQSQLIQIPFWSLIPDDQKFIARCMREGRQNEEIPGITDGPREWLIGGHPVTGQLLEVADSTLFIVVNGERNEFAFDELSGRDIEYAQSWVPPAGQQTRIEDGDRLVAEATTVSPGHSAGDGSSGAVESAPASLSAGTAKTPERSSFQLIVTVLVCLMASGWRLLRRFLNSESQVDF